MIGFSLAILAGILISLQSVFNAKVNENVGQWLTTTCVLGIGLISSILFYIISLQKTVLTLKCILQIICFM